MNQPELERERGEFEKWVTSSTDWDAVKQALTTKGVDVNGAVFYKSPIVQEKYASWLSSQQSTLRRVRAILGNSIIIDADKPLVRDVLAAIEREFGLTEEK